DTPMASFVRPALTTISLPTYQIGASAARMLLGLLAGEAIDERICLPTQLVVRQSSDSNLGQQ
ncbi:MAG TPA: substrate-binding domain-containing protein, partial [Chloroflexota bacterium]|nr:substrate-binding domain-containing protein [Chloroflexota bacterium]